MSEAGGLYSRSVEISRAVGNKMGTLVALESLAGVYKTQGNNAGYQTATKEINDIKHI